MTFLQFLASAISSLAWPATIITIVMSLRKPIAGALMDIKTLRYKDFEADFGRQLTIAEESAEKVIEAAGAADKPSVNYGPRPREVADRHERFMQLLDISPRSAVVDAWIDIEELLRKIGDREGLNPKVPTTRHIETLPPYLKGLVLELRHIRNSVIHADFEISRSAASRFGEIAAVATTALLQLSAKKEA